MNGRFQFKCGIDEGVGCLINDPYSTALTQEHGLQFRLRLAVPKLVFNIIHHIVEVGSCFCVYVYLAFSDSHIVIDLSVETSAAWFRLAHGMSHLCATMGILPVIFIVFLPQPDEGVEPLPPHESNMDVAASIYPANDGHGFCIIKEFLEKYL